MHKRQVLFALILVVILTILVSGIASGKAHVRVNQVQVCHKGTARSVAASALATHLAHSDFRLPACHFDNVFGDGADCSGVANDGTNADILAKGNVNDPDLENPPGTDLDGTACGFTPACPAGGPPGPNAVACF